MTFELVKHLLFMLITPKNTLHHVSYSSHGPYSLPLHSEMQIPTPKYNPKLIPMDSKI
jgi:hypothetical protein